MLRSFLVATSLLVMVPAAGSCADVQREGAEGESGRVGKAELILFTLQDLADAEPVEVADGGTILYRDESTCYGWQLMFEPVDEQLKLEELLLLPGQAPNWPADGATIAEDGMSARSELIVSGHTGTASNVWCVAEGDPDGLYKFVISQEGRTLGQGTFYLAAAKR